MKFGKKKEIVRQDIIHILSLKKPKRVFTLPGSKLTIEVFCLKYGATVTACEKKREVYKHQVRTFPKSIKLNNKLSSAVLPNHEFDFIWLDFCSQLCDEVIKSVKSVRLADKGYLILTLMAARDGMH